MLSKKLNRTNPYIDIVQIHPVRTIGDYSVVDVMIKYIKEYFPCRYFLRGNKVILAYDRGNFRKLCTVSIDSRGNLKKKGSATGKYTLNKVLEKEYQGLIALEYIPDLEVLKYIPLSVMKKFGYNLKNQLLISEWRKYDN